jgi:hypothetical protein
VVETPFFLRKATGLPTDGERDRMIAFAGANPEAGGVVPEAGGVVPESGGVRVIYYFHNEAFPIFLLTVSAKKSTQRHRRKPPAIAVSARRSLPV